MTDWPRRPLDELLDLHDSRRVPLSSAERAGRSGPYPYYGAQGVIDHIDDYIFDGRYILIPEDGENLRSRKLPIAYFAEGKFWVNNHAHIASARDGVAVDRFVQSAIEATDISPYITGAAQPKLSQRNLRQVEIPVPALEVQRSVAAVLDAFDDLIENNRRRVEVLEDMARATYREWFVHFRFPGHEGTTLVESDLGPIPEGWRVARLGDVVTLHYGKALKKADRRGGDVAVLGSSGVVGWHDESVIDGPAIVVGRKGNVGSITWVDGAAWPIDTTYFVETSLPLRYTCEHLRHVEFLNSHAAVPGLSRDQAYSRPFVVPGGEIAAWFDELADALLKEASTLSEQAEILASLRDLLLPKLVTGKIDVSSLDLDAVVEKVAI